MNDNDKFVKNQIKTEWLLFKTIYFILSPGLKLDLFEQLDGD